MNGVEYVQINIQKMIYSDVLVVMQSDIKIVQINTITK